MTREKAIDLLDNLIGMVDDNHDSDYDTALKMAVKALEQEPKTGHWINCHCDCCGKDMAFHIGRCGGIAYTEMFYSDYCPNCGARMESEVRND